MFRIIAKLSEFYIDGERQHEPKIKKSNTRVLGDMALKSILEVANFLRQLSHTVITR